MSSKPGVFALSKEATLFVFGNVGMLFHHMKILLPLMLVATVIKQAGKMAQADWVAFAMAIVTLFLFACFALAWHRTSLQGPDKAHEVNPVTLHKTDWKFIALFVGISVAFAIFAQVLSYISGAVLPRYGQGIAVAGNIVSAGVMIYGMIVFLRASFLFPAQSVGVRLTWKEACAASKGLIWPLLGSDIIFTLIFIVAFSVYTFVAGLITGISIGQVPLGRVEVIAIGFVLSVPIVLASFFLIALCVTALSRAYQWGMQNNTPAQAA